MVKVISHQEGTTIKVKSPGRVNLLGEHVDYNGGIVLPAAIDRVVHLEGRPRPDNTIHITSLDFGEEVFLDPSRLAEKVDGAGKPLHSWAIYAAGVAYTLQLHGFSTPGLDVSFNSDVPIGAGLSSSAAVEVGFAVLWQALGGWEMDRLRLAQYCQQAENNYVGVNCGLMDQFACANGVEGHALFFDTRALTTRAVPLPREAVMVIADSGVRRSLASSAYNDRRAACEMALVILQSFLPNVHDLRDVTPNQFGVYEQHLPDIPRKRARHVVNECARVERAPALLQAEDAAGFGELMLACHASLRDDFEVSCPELNTLVEIASSLEGCWGARLTGAGFGGCTVNLVHTSFAERFMDALKTTYQDRTGREAQVYICHASRGAWVESE